MWSKNCSRSWDKKCIENAELYSLINVLNDNYSVSHNMYDIKHKLREIDINEWHVKLFNDRNNVNGNKLRVYREYKNNLETSMYLKLVSNRQHRRVLSNYRSGCLPLAVETGRYTKPKVPLINRRCIYCTDNCIEDEKHFLLKCDFYSDLRYSLEVKACEFDSEFLNFSVQDKFLFFMTNDFIQPFLAKTLFSLFNRRKYANL